MLFTSCGMLAELYWCANSIRSKRRRTGSIKKKDANSFVERMRIDPNVIGVLSSNPIEYGFNVSGKQVDAGKIGYQTFTSGALDVVGAGTTAGSRKVKLWDNVEVPGTLTVSGTVLGKFRDITSISFNQGTYKNNCNCISYIPAAGDAADDEWIGLAGEDNDRTVEWVAPYDGKLVKIVLNSFFEYPVLY